MYGVKWQNFKMVTHLQQTMTDPALRLPTPHIINLDTDPHKRKVYEYPSVHSWTITHTVKLLEDFNSSVALEPLIPVGAPLDFIPKRNPKPKW